MICYGDGRWRVFFFFINEISKNYNKIDYVLFICSKQPFFFVYYLVLFQLVDIVSNTRTSTFHMTKKGIVVVIFILHSMPI